MINYPRNKSKLFPSAKQPLNLYMMDFYCKEFLTLTSVTVNLQIYPKSLPLLSPITFYFFCILSLPSVIFGGLHWYLLCYSWNTEQANNSIFRTTNSREFTKQYGNWNIFFFQNRNNLFQRGPGGRDYTALRNHSRILLIGWGGKKI